MKTGRKRSTRSRSGAARQARNDRLTQAYRQLREWIIWGRLAPRTRIIETDVGTRLRVSRTPVRSALQRLQQEGYITAAGSGATAAIRASDPATAKTAVLTDWRNAADRLSRVIESPLGERGIW